MSIKEENLEYRKKTGEGSTQKSPRLGRRFGCEPVYKPSKLRSAHVVLLESPASPEEERYGDGQGGDERQTEGGQDGGGAGEGGGGLGDGADGGREDVEQRVQLHHGRQRLGADYGGGNDQLDWSLGGRLTPSHLSSLQYRAV